MRARLHMEETLPISSYSTPAFEIVRARVSDVVTEALAFVVMRSLLVAASYIVLFVVIAWFAFKLAQITE